MPSLSRADSIASLTVDTPPTVTFVYSPSSSSTYTFISSHVAASLSSDAVAMPRRMTNERHPMINRDRTVDLCLPDSRPGSPIDPFLYSDLMITPPYRHPARRGPVHDPMDRIRVSMSGRGKPPDSGTARCLSYSQHDSGRINSVLDWMGTGTYVDIHHIISQLDGLDYPSNHIPSVP